MSRASALARRYWGVFPVAIVVALFAVRACVVDEQLDRLARSPAAATDPPGTAMYSGSIFVARGGPVVFGFLSPTPARLLITEPRQGSAAPVTHQIAGPGLQQSRIVVPHGTYEIVFTAPPDARLVWQPVGRRGVVEYVAPSSLSPDPPDRAVFDRPGVNLGDGVISLAMLFVIAVSILALARRRLLAMPRELWLAIGGVLVVALAIRWIDIGGFGAAWDEDVNWAAGRNYIGNVLSLDFRHASWQWNYPHPPVMKYLAGVGAQFSDGYGPARVLSALCLSIACALLVPIGARLYSLRVGILAGVIAALLPPLVAHGQVVGHESVTVLWWTLGMLLVLGVNDDSPSLRRLRIRLVGVGVVIGIAFASRFINGLLGPLCLVVLALATPRESLRTTLREAFWILPLVSFVTLYVTWPWLWAHPIDSLRASFKGLDLPHATEPFLGEVIEKPGPLYFAIYLFVTAPLGVLACVLAGFVRTFRERRILATWIPIAWLVVPQAIIFSPVRQDGVRYIMPSVIALAVIAAVGVDMIATLLERHWRPMFLSFGAAVALYLGITLARVHPYYLDFFGEHVGGPGVVAERGWFETAWWGEGLAPAIEYVNEHAAPGARVYRDCIRPVEHMGWFREDLWAPMVRDPRQAEWIVRYAPQTRACWIPRDANKVFEVSLHGAIFAEVFRRE